jgi:hypothetical protein
MKQTLATGARFTMIVALAAVMGAATAARAQLRPMGLPLNTTLVIAKPAPDQLYGNKPIITLGVGTKEYKFLLDDAYVDDPGGRIQWPDIWQQVRVYRPNFVMQGPNVSMIENLNPGDMVTVKGMYAPLDRTFEIMFIQPGKGAFEPKKTY